MARASLWGRAGPGVNNMHVTVITRYTVSIWRIAKGEPERAGHPLQARGPARALGGWAQRAAARLLGVAGGRDGHVL